MATPALDVSLLSYFSPVMVFIFIWVFVYASFHYTKIFGDNKILAGIIGFVVGVIFLTVSSLTQVVMVIAPWFTALFVFLIFTIVVFKIFGATDDNIRSVIKTNSTLQWTLIILCLIIAIAALSAVFGQRTLEFTEGLTPAQEGTITVGSSGEEITIGAPGAQSQGGSTATGSFGKNLSATLYHPKILGLIFILIIASLTVAMLSQKMAPS
ncbi:hypothetical protein J4434_04115 [Candidatus Woesearchaeota archaeon]|nr:hypothetical protein [Candidatus Woesearchaeota archaeon]